MNYVPSKAEQATIRKLTPLHVELRRIEKTMLNPPSYRGDIDFVKRGVRTNGTQRAWTIVTLRRDIRNYNRALSDYAKAIINAAQRADTMAKEATTWLSKFKTCPACHGEQGVKEKFPHTSASGWTDCEQCQGTGMLEKEKL